MILALVAEFGDPLVHSAFVTFELPSGEVGCRIACRADLKKLVRETILHATQAHHDEAGGLH